MPSPPAEPLAARTPTARPTTFRELLVRNRNVRLLWLGQIVSQLGEWFNVVAVYTLLLDLTGSATAVAVMMVVQQLPIAVFGPLAGVLVEAPAAFTAYGSTIAGHSVASSDIGSTSLACLSCHDGTTTFDNLVNAPGKSGVVNNRSDRGFTFWDAAVPGAVSDFMTSSRLNIGLNLSNDHPVSIVYDAGAASLRPTNTIIADIDLTGDLQVSAATFDNGNMTKNLWAVKGYVDATATIADLLRGGKVECSSCHDPHFNNKSWNEIHFSYCTDTAAQEPENNGLFLRRVGGNSGSGLCRTCHNK